MSAGYLLTGNPAIGIEISWVPRAKPRPYLHDLYSQVIDPEIQEFRPEMRLGEDLLSSSDAANGS